MNNKRYRTIMSLIVILIVLAGGLFIYQNVFVARLAQAKMVTVYVAKADIQAYTSVSADQFDTFKVAKNSVVPGMVTDVNSVVGEQLKGGLLKGEVLSTARLQAKGTKNEGTLTMKLDADSTVGDVKAGDNVAVYVTLVNKDPNTTSVSVLYPDKKILDIDNSKEASKGVSLSGSSNNSVTSYDINVSEAELKEYYEAKSVGYIEVARINTVDDKNTSNVSKFDVNSNEVKTASKGNTNSDSQIAVMSYVVKQGDTVDSIAQKFKTTKVIIEGLNGGNGSFKEGDTISVPAN